VRDAHYWARELQAVGHEVRLMPAQYVKAYVKRNKNDAADAEAIGEAVRRPTMRFVPIKTAEHQAALLVHRGRERLVRQRTALVNALRVSMAGQFSSVGRGKFPQVTGRRSGGRGVCRLMLRRAATSTRRLGHAAEE
jgi:transposase